VESFTLRPLYPRRKSTVCPPNKGLSGPQNTSGHFGEARSQTHRCKPYSIKYGSAVLKVQPWYCTQTSDGSRQNSHRTQYKKKIHSLTEQNSKINWRLQKISQWSPPLCRTAWKKNGVELTVRIQNVLRTSKITHVRYRTINTIFFLPYKCAFIKKMHVCTAVQFTRNCMSLYKLRNTHGAEKSSQINIREV
jgi:hypothetical protein